MRLPSLLALATLLTGCASPLAATPEGASLACPAPCAVTLDSGGYAWEPHVAVDPTDPLHLIAAWTRYLEPPGGGALVGDILVVTTRDGGSTWSRAAIPHGADATSGSPLATSTFLADPSVHFTPEGEAFLLGLAIDAAMTPAGNVGHGFRIFSVRTPDGGSTFETPVLIADSLAVKTQTPFGNRGITGVAPDFPWGGVSPDGTIVVTWRDIDQDAPGGMDRSLPMFAVSRDGARSWSGPTRIDIPTRDGANWATHLTADGTWLTAFATWDESEADVLATFEAMLGRSTDQGRTWTFTPLDAGPIFNGGFVETALGLGLAYSRPAGDKERLVVRYTPDDGATFGPELVLVDGVAGPMLAATASDGMRAYATYYEGDGSTFSVRALAFGAGAVAGPIALRGGLTRSGAETGEYYGVAALPDGAFAVFTTDETDEGRLEGAHLRWS